MSKNLARDILWPTDPSILVRIAILHVGQGSSAIVFAADGATYKTLLVDINLDGKADGIDVPMLIGELVGDNGLDVFVNTHPHDDHLRGVKSLSDKMSISEVWHSGHVPSRKEGKTYYEELAPVIDKVKRDGGKEIILEGSRDQKTIGEARYYVLSPAAYVTDEVNEEDAETRYRRIHEQCAVLKFGTTDVWAMLPGDADRDAFAKHIAHYHKERLSAVFLAASHHGSRTFFRYAEADEPYREALDQIDPDYVVVSAPRQSESRHDHPHQDAMAMYQEKVGNGNLLHTGENRYSFICDIFRDGSYGGVDDDKGELAEAYPIDDSNGDGDGGSRAARVAVAAPATRPRVDDRPMGCE